jgi:hypothetical protein
MKNDYMKTAILWMMKNILWTFLLLPAFSAWLDGKETTPWISDYFGWIYRYAVDLVGEPNFPWISGTLLGITIGVFSHKIFIWLVRTKSENKFDNLNSLLVDVQFHLHNSSGIRGAIDRDRSGFVAKVEILFAALEKQRIMTPNLLGNDYVPIVEAYANYLRPFIKGRNIRTLRRRAKVYVNTLKEVL